MFETKYRIKNTRWVSSRTGDLITAYKPQYRPWWSPLWLNCSLAGGMDILGWEYPTAFRAMLHIKNVKKLRGADPSALPSSVVWQE